MPNKPTLPRLRRRPAAGAADFEEIAQLLTPSPEEWLLEYLRKWAPTVFLAVGVHMAQPARAEMRTKLEKVAGAAVVLLEALSDTATKEFLDLEGRGEGQGHGPIQALGSLQHALIDLRDRGTRAARSPALVDAKGKTKAGTGRALPGGATLPQATCALVIAEAWKFVRGKYPGPRNRPAAEAAEKYWVLCGAERRSWSAKTAGAWRKHFERARSPELEKDRNECRRHLREGRRMAQFLSDGSMEEAGTELT